MGLVNIIKDGQPQCNVQHDYKFPTGQPAGVFGPQPFAIVEGLINQLIGGVDIAQRHVLFAINELLEVVLN